MRIWSLHPEYLDSRGLVALWREGLLAQKVLRGLTRGYINHPQLTRWRRCADPIGAIAAYLQGVLAEADRRGYKFDGAKILPAAEAVEISVTAGQLLYEWDHLKRKLAVRAPDLLAQWNGLDAPETHSIFTIVPGDVEDWERRV